MSLNRTEKEAVIAEVAAQAGKSQTLALAEYRGLTVAQLDQLRKTARSQGVYLHVLRTPWPVVLWLAPRSKSPPRA